MKKSNGIEIKNFYDAVVKKFYGISMILKKSQFDIVTFSASIADFMVPIKYSPNLKYNYNYFFTCLYDFAISSSSFRKYKGPHNFPIDGKYLNQIHNKLCKNKVYDEINRQLLNRYFKKNKEIKTKYQIIDSSFIQNKGGSVKNNNHLLSEKEKIKNAHIRNENIWIDKENIKIKSKNNKINNTNDKIPYIKKKKERTFIENNRYNGRKKYFKIDTITDSIGTPLVSTFVSSKQSDCDSLEKTINSLPINLNTLNNSKINRYKQYFLADSGYHSKKNIDFVEKKGYIPLIKYNKRNERRKHIIKKNTFKGKQLKIYKKRMIIESFFSWIKNCPTINQNYQKTIESFNGLLLLCSSFFISKRMNIILIEK